ncbi:MAG: carbamoyltransferase HypF [Rhodospirillaceae bacterium]
MNDLRTDSAALKVTEQPDIKAIRMVVTGRVQGVGFRPFVYSLAKRLGVSGSVTNQSGRVIIFAQGSPSTLEVFEETLIKEAPPLALPKITETFEIRVSGRDTFYIRKSLNNGPKDAHISPDFSVCTDCLSEMQDPSERRYKYPFINCTQCGPRYTIIKDLPYDRANTAMAPFPLCDDCRAEYEDPRDRRFHAQPLACPVCGPKLLFRSENISLDNTNEALAACVEALRMGMIAAVKSVGGYHLMCDATSDEAVSRLRTRKHRPDKPLAVMFPMSGEDGLAAVRDAVALDRCSVYQILNSARPIVLAPKRQNSDLSALLAPGLDCLGVFLPYSPLHHLLLEDFGRPVVATSGNISGEPVLTDNTEADRRLATIADVFLHHDRPILRPADDSVFAMAAGKARPIRLGRGWSPMEMKLPGILPEPILALGGHMKATVALAWDNRVVVSPHIGDLGSRRCLEVLAQVAADLQRIYGITARTLVCDVHPSSPSTRWAEDQRLPIQHVFHHHAHASALAGEHPELNQWLMFTWDGIGVGEDGTLWGGEALLGRPGGWRRTASLRPFRIPGGDKAGREPWRSAAALCWELKHNSLINHRHLVTARNAWRAGINTPVTTSVGRLFDAAACLILGLETTSFEGHGPMMLEAIAGDSADAIMLPLQDDSSGILRTDWAPLLPLLTDRSRPSKERSAVFHATLAAAIIDQARVLADRHHIDAIGLTGGVFQNRRLIEQIFDRSQTLGIPIYMPERMPINDGGLSYGQTIEILGGYADA